MKLHTYSGSLVDPIRMKQKELNIEDIAHGLSNLCRFSGQCPWFYSVAQHSILVSDWLRDHGFSRFIQLAGLLHDASEAYLVDIPTMLKQKLPTYRRWEKSLQTKIYKRYIPKKNYNFKFIKQADEAVLQHELYSFFAVRYNSKFNVHPILPMHPKEAKDVFLHVFDQLTNAP